ncbi:MAG: Peptide chain release factor 2 [Firmicutes bacterium]|nr:Peptide chain release factor 2 [Bacillota bacterium]MBT9158443.1 Peptide chain release factor 2 [Bacillota bacterium]
MAAAQKTLAELSALQGEVGAWQDLRNEAVDISELIALAEALDDPGALGAVPVRLALLEQQLGQLELKLLLSGSYAKNHAILELHPGAGGVDSQDWAAMLMRMYIRYAEKRGFIVDVLDYLAGDEAGLKSVSLQVRGDYAYGYLHAEKGVHRLVRLSPFDAAGRRHTSFASVSILPVIDEEVALEISAEDLRIDTYRSSGAGGQNVNKTDSAVRITHLPTNIVVQCQNERSQLSNKNTAMRMLRGKLAELRVEEQQQEIDRLRGDIGAIAWGNQVRSYVFHPYSMVKDHRTGVETGNVQAVMDGSLDQFIDAYLRWQATR